jgi:hypothetical protein
MKLKELIDKIDIDAVIANDPGKCELHGLFELFDIEHYINYDKADEQDRLFSGHIITWCCTDSWVGLRVYVFDREVVALSTQVGRKYDQVFSWVSPDAYNKVKQFCQSLIEQQESEFDLINFEEEIEDTYTIYYSGGLIPHIHKTANLNGEVVKVIGNANKSDYISKKVNIEHGDGSITVENIESLKFPLMLTKEH